MTPGAQVANRAIVLPALVAQFAQCADVSPVDLVRILETGKDALDAGFAQ